MEATITLKYRDTKTAAAIAKAVAPDNATAPSGLKVETSLNGREVVTNINLNGKLSTFISTIDDLLESISTAEKTLASCTAK